MGGNVRTERQVGRTGPGGSFAGLRPGSSPEDAGNAHVQSQRRDADAALDVLPDAVVTTDLRGRIMYANRQFLCEVGRTQEQVLGRVLSDLGVLAREPSLQPTGDILPKLTAEGPLTVETTVQRAHGRPFPALLSFGLICNDAGETQGVVWLIRDISRLEQAQRELQECGEQLSSAEHRALLAMFGAKLIEDLTQPLSVIRLATQTALAELKRADGPDAMMQDLEASLAASATMTAVISQLRDLAKQSDGTRETEVCIRGVAEWTIQLLEHRVQQVKGTVRTENLEVLPAIRMRENDLRLLFFALVRNAIEATDDTEAARLVITGAVHGDAIKLQFQDNCRGIDPACLVTIFEPFSTSMYPGKAARLGLCVARDIARQRGGEISVQNRPGEGDTFTVTLPIR